MRGLLVSQTVVLLIITGLGQSFADDGEVQRLQALAQENGCGRPGCGVVQDPASADWDTSGWPAGNSSAFMRATNRLSLELVKRETDHGNFAYFVDTEIRLDVVANELRANLGKILKSSSYPHAHSVEFIISNHKASKGWPSANHIHINDRPIRSVCVLSPLSHEKTAIEFAAQLMGTRRLPVVHLVDDFAMRFLAASHEGYHCISAHRSRLDHRAKTALETISDVGAVNEALKAGINPAYLVALADWRALRFASGIADVVAGRTDGKRLYSRAAPAHMSTVAINRLLANGPLDSYDGIEQLALSSTPEGLYGERKKAQVFLTQTMLLFKNTEVTKRYPHASLQDADDILSMLDAPAEMIEAVKTSVARYLGALDCRRALVRSDEKQTTVLACRQSDGSFSLVDEPALGVLSPIATLKIPRIDVAEFRESSEHARALLVYTKGRGHDFPNHEQYHLNQVDHGIRTVQ